MKGLFIFAAGLAVGAVSGAYLVKNKVLADAKQEIEEVREYYKEKARESKVEEKEEVKEEKTEEQPKDEQAQYEAITNKYTNYNKIAPKEIDIPNVEEPYIIDPEEVGNDGLYDITTLTYFADGVLVDDVDEVIEDVDTVVGLSNLKIFEEFGASAIYVRSELYGTDFEILRDDWKWSDLQEESDKKPHQL